MSQKGRQTPNPKTGLTRKQQVFVDEYKRGGNGTKAAKKAYDTDSDNVANAIAVENLRKPVIRKEVWNDEVVEKIEHHLVNLAMGAENENVQLGASKFITEMNKGKPQTKVDVTSQGEKLQGNVIQFIDGES